MYISTKQTCVDYCRGELFEAVKPFMKCNDSPSIQPEPSYHDLASVGLNSSEIDENWLGPFNSKEQAQLDASFRQTTPQQVAHEIDSQSNVDIARSGISHSKKKKAIERIQKDYGITPQIVEQHYGMTHKQAAKALNVSNSKLKRIRQLYGMPRWPNHKTRKAYQHDALRTEIETLRTNLAESQEEVARLKDQLLQQQQDNNARVDRLLKLLESSHSPPPSSS